MCISFAYLMAYQRRLPYATPKCIRQCGFSSALIVFLYFLFALLIKAKVTITNGHDNAFYGTIIGILTCAIFSVPVFIVVRTARWSIVDVSKDDRDDDDKSTKGDDDDAADEEEGCGDGALPAADKSRAHTTRGSSDDDGAAEEAVSPTLLKVLMLPTAPFGGAADIKPDAGDASNTCTPDAQPASLEAATASDDANATAGAAGGEEAKIDQTAPA